MGIFSDLGANAHLTTPLMMLPASKFMVPNWSEGPNSMNHQDGRHITTGDRTFSVYRAAPFIHLLEVFTVKKSYTFFGKIAG